MSKLNHKDFSCILNIIDSIEKIQKYSGAHCSADDFHSEVISFDATMMNFIVIGEMAAKLSDELLNETAKQIDWSKIKGFRNIIAHNYFGIDAEEVWQIIQIHIPEFKYQLKKIIE